MCSTWSKFIVNFFRGSIRNLVVKFVHSMKADLATPPEHIFETAVIIAVFLLPCTILQQASFIL